MPPKFKTIAIDSASEWARLTFSKTMKKSAKDLEKIREPFDYPGATERIQMVVRRMKDYKAKGIEVVITAHEQIEKIYAKGGMITPKGQTPQEPIAVAGWPDLPGKTAPAEVMRALDNVFRMKWMNGKKVWNSNREPLGGGGDYWEVKDRFNAPAIQAGYLPANYFELAELARANAQCNWEPPYLWMLYGVPGIGKTRSLLTFPRPIIIFDIDRGTASISKEIKAPNSQITVKSYVSEEQADYEIFLKDLEEAANA